MKRKEQSQTDLATLLSQVLKHPDTPTVIYNDIMDALCDLSSGVIDMTTPEFIGKVIAANKVGGEQ